MKGRGRTGAGRAFLLSAAAHFGALVLIWVVTSRIESTPPMRVYAVNIVSPPPQQLGPPNPQPAQPTPPEPEPEPEAEPEPEPPAPAPPPPPPPPQRQPAPAPAPPPQRQAQAPRPPPQQQQQRPQQQQPQQQAQASTGPRPDPSSAGGENINMQLRGVQCPTPDYCNNIIRQINRYFRSPGGSGQADIYFVINRDGSVSDLRLVSSTGGASFRLAVLEAVEQAGINRAFGPLPQPYQADQLPVSFFFRPAT